MRCSLCNGYVWTESDRALLKSWKEHILQYGFEIVCIAGHRQPVTPGDVREYIKNKEEKNVSEKNRCNKRKAGKY